MNISNQESDLIIRLRKLEKSQARYRFAFLFTAALAAAFCMIGAKRHTDDLIQAKSFEVVNDDAKVLARFTSAAGKGEMRMYRTDGSPLANVSSSTDSSGRVDLFNANGKPMISLSSTSTGAGSITLKNSLGALSVQVASNTQDHGGLWVFNADGKQIAVITTSGTTANGIAETYDAAGTKSGHLP